MECHWLSKIFELYSPKETTKYILRYIQQKQKFYEIMLKIFGRLKIPTTF